MSKDQDWTVVRMLNWATDYFRDKSVASPRLSIEWLLAEVLEIRRLDLYMQYDRPLTPQELNKLRPLVKRRASHEPLQYIVGYTDFFNCRINVKPGVLIPRPETEQLAELILTNHQHQSDIRVLDVGTGSGCLAIALKYERPGWQVTALDNSTDALESAKANAELNSVEIKFLEADFAQEHTWKNLDLFDLIISNPPYIPDKEFENLDLQVREYEPRQALYATQVTQPYAHLAEMGHTLLKPGGTLYAELNSSYHQEIAAIFNTGHWSSSEILEDYGKTPRFLKTVRYTD